MTPATLLVELAEKMGLLAAAALLAVLIPALRNRLLGVGRRVDKLAAVVLGLGLSAWGAMLGLHVAGEDINVRATPSSRLRSAGMSTARRAAAASRPIFSASSIRSVAGVIRRSR